MSGSMMQTCCYTKGGKSGSLNEKKLQELSFSWFLQYSYHLFEGSWILQSLLLFKEVLGGINGGGRSREEKRCKHLQLINEPLHIPCYFRPLLLTLDKEWKQICRVWNLYFIFIRGIFETIFLYRKFDLYYSALNIHNFSNRSFINVYLDKK